MKTVDTSLKSMLASDNTTLATFLKITRRDGIISTFTDHDVSVTLGGLSYIYNGAIEITPSQSTMDSIISNLEVNGIFETGSILRSDIISRYLDHAKVEIFIADYIAPPASLTDTSVVWLQTGKVGSVKIDNEKWVLEVRSLKQLLKQRVGFATSKSCRYDLFDDNCQKSVIGFKHTGFVQSISGKEVTTDIVGANSLIFPGGKLSVPSKGFFADIDSVSGSVVKLYQTVEATALIGELVTITSGCDKSLSTCFNVYANGVNFGGEPHSPTADEWQAGTNTTTTSN